MMANRPDEVIPAPAPDLCLNFANTRYWRGTAKPAEELREPDDLLRWIGAGRRLAQDQASTIFTEAIALREVIHRCFAATASGRTPDEADLSALNAALAAAPARQRVRPGGWDVISPQPTTSVLLAPVLWSAADLLVGPQLQRVRQCANPECGWLFLDNSKSGNRRWCSMSACGNRAKAHRHYLRTKAG
jgi:predicted RNA-binding Zn ribbon-like protein